MYTPVISDAKPFLIDKYPVSVGMFRRFLKMKTRYVPRANKQGYSYVFRHLASRAYRKAKEVLDELNPHLIKVTVTLLLKKQYERSIMLVMNRERLFRKNELFWFPSLVPCSWQKFFLRFMSEHGTKLGNQNSSLLLKSLSRFITSIIDQQDVNIVDQQDQNV